MNLHYNSTLKIIKAGRLIDGTGGEPLINQAIIVQDAKIQDIKPETDETIASLSQQATVFDLGDATLIPGLIDTHLHLTFDPINLAGYYDPTQDTAEIVLRTIGNAQAALRAGVTTVGDCGAQNHIIFPVREAIATGQIIGPRILSSGNALAPVGGHGADRIGKIASGIEAVRTAVREQVEAGADFIKVMATGGGGEDPSECHYDVAELTAIREEAAGYGKKVAAHAHGSQGIRNCIAAGIQRIEHCTFFNGDHFAFDPAAAQMIADQNIIVSPTNVIDYRRIETKGQGAPRQELNKIWRQLLAHNVLFAASSDAGVTDILYDDYALIPELMVTELGMSPMQAILSSTKTAAEALDLASDLGTLEVGKQADLVVVKGNPLEDITALRQVGLVIRQGEVVYDNRATIN